MLGYLNLDEAYVAGFISFAFVGLAVCLAIICTPIIIEIHECHCCSDDWSDDEDDGLEEEHMFN